MTDAIKPVLNTTRRQFAAMGVAAAAATGLSTSANAASLTVAERAVSVAALSGTTAGTLIAPELGEHPGLVMFATPAAGRAANAAVARQLAGQGWAVLLVDLTASEDPTRINREARAHSAWLAAQPGVAKSDADYTLRSFSAAFPKLSLASRAERQAAALSGVLFAVPAKVSAKHDSLHGAARTLHRLAA